MTPTMDEPETLEEILARKPNHPKKLIDSGILYEKTKLVIYGRYKALKSMLELDMAFALASGDDWIGFHTKPEGSRVFYLQLEIPYGLLRIRLAKTWKGRSGHQQPVDHKNLRFWTQHFLKLDSSVGIHLLDHYLQEHRPDVLIVDPLYKVLSGNLLQAVDVQRVLDTLDTFIAKYSLSVVVVSHTRKGEIDMGEWGSDDLIGSVFLSAWADTIVKVERKGGDRLDVKFDVVRHAEEELEKREVLFDRNTLEFSLIMKPAPDSTEKEQQ